MSRKNRVNPDHYKLGGRLTPDELARERQKQHTPPPRDRGVQRAAADPAGTKTASPSRKSASTVPGARNAPPKA